MNFSKITKKFIILNILQLKCNTNNKFTGIIIENIRILAIKLATDLS